MLAGKAEKPKEEKLEKVQKAEKLEDMQGAEEAQETEENNGKIISAETLSKEFKEHSVAEFFKKNRQMLGLYGKIRTLTTIVHEYVTNSLDASEEANILPDIEVKVEELGEEYYVVSVQDNGPGLTKETVGKALGQLLAGTKFHRMVQMRGQQGIGASGCTMLSQMTTGKPTKVITGTGNGKTYSLEISIDTKENRPKISNLKEMLKQFRGVAIQAKFKGVLYKESDQGVLEYLRRTAIANPHAQIKFRDPKGILTTFHRSVNKIPKRPTEMKPHPLGVTIDDILSWSKTTDARKTNSFLKKAFDRVGDTSIDKIQQNVRFDLNKDPKQLSWEEAEQIIHSFKQVNFTAPSTEGLCPIGEEHIKKSLENVVKPEIVYTLTRKPTVYSGGFPFQVEVAIAYGGDAGRVVNETTPKEGEVQERRVEIMRYSNRAPLMFDAGTCAITKAVQSIDWKRYAMGDINNAPISIFVNFISVHVPYTGAGKTSIADEEEVMEELRLALMQVGRKTARYIIKKEKEKIKQEKKRVFMKYAIEVAKAVGELTKKDPAKIEKKLLDIVIKRLKLEEEQEKKEEEALEEEDDEKLEKELDKLVKKKEAEEKKVKGGKKKSKKATEESDEE
ncbi:MAG: DNA topoisomerase VI subunit B [archaeon]